MHAHREVVLVEDDGPMREAIQRLLGGSGYAVESYPSAEDLLAKLDGGLKESCRCCVCDVRLPGMSGFELHRRLAQFNPPPAWIFITAHDDSAVRDQAHRLHADYLLKPFQGRALLALVHSATCKDMS